MLLYLFMNIKQLTKYRQGYKDADECIKTGKNAKDLLIRSRNRWYNQGVLSRIGTVSDSRIEDEYTLNKVSPDQYSVEENGEHKTSETNSFRFVIKYFRCKC